MAVCLYAVYQCPLFHSESTSSAETFAPLCALGVRVSALALAFSTLTYFSLSPRFPLGLEGCLVGRRILYSGFARRRRFSVPHRPFEFRACRLSCLIRTRSLIVHTPSAYLRTRRLSLGEPIFGLSPEKSACLLLIQPSGSAGSPVEVRVKKVGFIISPGLEVSSVA